MFFTNFRKLVYFLIFCFATIINYSCSSTKKFARQGFFDAKHEIIWSVNFIEDTINMTMGNEDWFVLKVGDNFSYGDSYRKSQLDSIQNLPREEFHFWLRSHLEDLSRGIEVNTLFWSSSLCRALVYKDYENKKISVIDHVSTHLFKYEEELIPQDWVIHDETTDIAGYVCQKAVCHWRGRDWVAWFTQEIPISEGPWKFHGLPGLIIKIYDTKHHYEFELVRFESVEKKIDIQPLFTNKINYFGVKKLTKIERKTFLETKFGERGRLISEAEMARVGLNPNRVELKYGYIELDY